MYMYVLSIDAQAIVSSKKDNNNNKQTNNNINSRLFV